MAERKFYPQNSARPVQGTKHNRGEFPAAGNSLNEPWPGAYDQTVHKNRISDMFSETGGGLTTRKVPLFDVDSDGQPITATAAIAQAAPTSTTTYFPPGPEYGYNAISGDYEVQQPGQPYAADGTRPNFQYPVGNAPQTDVSPATKQSIAAMFGPAFGGGWGSTGFNLPSMNQTEANGMPIDSDRPLNLHPGVTAGSRAKPASPISQMFGRNSRGLTARESMDLARRTNPSVWDSGDNRPDNGRGQSIYVDQFGMIN